VINVIYLYYKYYTGSSILVISFLKLKKTLFHFL
jgi:hypothetical protein